MPSGFLEVTPRNFNAMSVPGLTQEAGDGVNAALKAMSTWRNEIADTNEKKRQTCHRKNGCGCRGGRMAGTSR